MKRLVTIVIIFGLGSCMISCSDEFATIEKNVLESEKKGTGGDGGGDGNEGGGGGLPG